MRKAPKAHRESTKRHASALHCVKDESEAKLNIASQRAPKKAPSESKGARESSKRGPKEPHGCLCLCLCLSCLLVCLLTCMDVFVSVSVFLAYLFACLLACFPRLSCPFMASLCPAVALVSPLWCSSFVAAFPERTAPKCVPKSCKSHPGTLSGQPWALSCCCRYNENPTV